MKVEQIYTGCLAQGAYYIENNGEAAVIDPLREVSPYITRAEKDGARIKYIFETHFHADFVSGHVTLSEQTGAPVVYGPSAEPSFDALIAEDGQVFKIGDLSIEVLHTPGHTMESSSYLLRDAEGKPHALFSGDTLFLGDVGRPDLAQKAANMTQEELAATLYKSLRSKIMTLPDDIIVYPGHGAGSACGKNMMKETVDTLGNQKKMNYALRADMTEEEFVKEVTEGLQAPPGYFPLNVQMNKEGYQPIEQIIEQGTRALNPSDFEKIANESQALILDVRSPKEYAQSHIPGSIFIGLDGGFAPWVGELIIDVKQAILLVVAPGREEEAVTRLSRVGFDKTLGYLEGGMQAWQESGKEVDRVESIPASDFADSYQEQKDKVYDVRKDSEFESMHLMGAHHTPLSHLNEHLSVFPSEDTFYIHCAGGYRSMIAASILKSRGIHNLKDIQGGMGAIASSEIPQSDFVSKASA